MERLKTKMEILTQEMESLIEEQAQLRNRSRAIEVRMNQLMGALQVLQEIVTENSVVKTASAVADLAESLQEPQNP